MAPITYQPDGLTTRARIFAKHNTTHPARKHPTWNIVDGLWQDDKGHQKIQVCSTLIHNCTKVTK